MTARHLVAMRGGYAIRRRRVTMTTLIGELAALRIDAPLRHRARQRQRTGNGVEPARVLAASGGWQAAQQTHRVRMPRFREHIACCAFFDEFPCIQYADAIAHSPDHREVMADEKH